MLSSNTAQYRAAKIRSLRHRAGISQRKLAELAKIPWYQTLQKWENGTRSIPDERYGQLVGILREVIHAKPPSPRRPYANRPWIEVRRRQ